MKLLYERSLVDNIRTTKIKAKLGHTKMTIEEERELIADYSPKFNFRDLTFQGYFKMADNGKDVIEATDNLDGELVKLNLTAKDIVINEKMELELSVSVESIKSNELGVVLDTKDKVAEAKILLFETVIYKAVKSIIEGLKDKENNFETNLESEEF